MYKPELKICIQESIEYARNEDCQKSKVAACTFRALEFKSWAIEFKEKLVPVESIYGIK